MTDLSHAEDAPGTPQIKIKRQRRRMYQQAPDQPEPTQAAASPQTLEADNASSAEGVFFDNDSANSPKEGENKHSISTELLADRIIENSMAAAMGMGILPLPLVDTAGIVGIQVYMMRKLSKLYGIEFSLIRSQAFVTSLIGGIGSVSVATGFLGSLVKLIPFFGGAAGALTLPVIAGSTTYAIGRLCIPCFSQGENTPVDNNETIHNIFKEYFKKGIVTATNLHNRVKSQKLTYY